ncbi:hypothetical protein [Kribbella sp. CA-293567]|uniref:hypothetical protein n=1 Tax=Kribbella sp. CA-293567 TaxID=3002436 RepID=UPI0022DDD318|nr:hypothetical protein [Kribbella sp. CA-293567]WBQ03474.1 hypothetical protein OX958_26305 [Kribbella sp. CA-293567]
MTQTDTDTGAEGKKASKEERKGQAVARLKKHEGGFLSSLADLDLRYDKTLRRAFTHLAVQSIQSAKAGADLKQLEVAAGGKAAALLRQGDPELSFRSMRQAIDAQLVEGRIEVRQVDELVAMIRDCRTLEVMRYTETGKKALYEAEMQAGRILQQFETESQALAVVADLIITYSDGKDPDALPDQRVATKYLVAKEQTTYRQQRRQVELEQIGDLCSKAFHFEIYKALAKLSPDKEHQKLESDLETMNRIYSNAEAVASAAGEGAGYASGTAGVAADISLGIARTGVDFLTNAAITASYHRQAKARVKEMQQDKEKVYAEVCGQLDGNRTAVAAMLATKYVQQVKEILNYSEVPIRASILATGIGLDQVGAGAATKVLSKAWDLLKRSVVEVADTFQQERLARAEEELGTVSGDQRISTMDGIWQEWAGGVQDRIFEQFKDNSAGVLLNVPDSALNALYDTTIHLIATELMGRLSIRPAQTFDAGLFFKHTNQMTGVRRRAETAEAAAKEAGGNQGARAGE